MAGAQDDITRLLKKVSEGHAEAHQDLYPAIYDKLRRIAHDRLVRHRPGETLNTTDLVHEAYLKLVDQSQAGWNDRAHFLATASRAMRFILIDYARRRTAQKRGGLGRDMPLSAVQIAADKRSADLISLNDALEKLAVYSERLAKVVEYRFFGGLTYEEIAEVTGWSVPTVRRDWKRARVWLYRAMQPDRDTPT